MLLAGGRCVVGGALVALVAALLGRQPGLRGNLAPYAALALLNVVGFFGLQTLAIDHLPSGFASVLLYLQPVLTVLLAAPFLGDRLTASRLVGAVTAFVGVAVVSLRPGPRGLGPRRPARDRGGGRAGPWARSRPSGSRHGSSRCGRWRSRWSPAARRLSVGRRVHRRDVRRRVRSRRGRAGVDDPGRHHPRLAALDVPRRRRRRRPGGGQHLPGAGRRRGPGLVAARRDRRLVAGRRHRAGVRRRAARERCGLRSRA